MCHDTFIVILPLSNSCVSLLKLALGVENIPPWVTVWRLLAGVAILKQSEARLLQHESSTWMCTAVVAMTTVEVRMRDVFLSWRERALYQDN